MSPSATPISFCALALTLVGAASLGCTGPKVIRVFNGQAVEGRFISYEAYAYYARAAEADARGDQRNAVMLFEGAAEEDPESPEIWTRLGRARCEEPSTRGSAHEAFRRAEDLDPRYAPLALEEARCAMAEGKLREALTHAARALALDPESDEIVILYATLLERNGHPEQAERALDALVIQDPTRVAGWLARYELATRRNDLVTTRHIAPELMRRAPRLSERIIKDLPELGPLASVDAAITREDLIGARDAARHAHLSSSELAVRAAALGKTTLARAQAELVLGADPSSSSARIALAVVADLVGDTTKLNDSLTLPTDTLLSPPSPLARVLFAELLARRVGPQAARAFIGTDDTSRSTETDPLLEAARRRVRARLAGT